MTSSPSKRTKGAMAGGEVEGAGPSLAAVVGAFFSFRVCITFLWFQAEPATATGIIVIVGLILFAAAVSWIWLNPPPIRSGTLYSAPTKWIFFYLGFAATSLLWTTAGSLTAALGYWLALAADVGTITLLLRYEPAELRADQVMKGYILGAVVVAIVAWCTPVMRDLRLGNEDFLHPNAIGFEFAIASLFAIYLSSQSALWKWLGVGLSITLLRTLSKASIVAFLAAAIFYLLRGAKVSPKVKLRIGVAAILVLFAFAGLLESYADIYSQGDRAETLTGRTMIWAQAFDIAIEKPWLGHGFYSFRWVIPPFQDFEPWQAHNELLQQFFTYGFAGLVMVVALYVTLARQILKSPEKRQRALAMALLVCAVVRGTVDTERFDLSYPLWLMAMMSAILFKPRLHLSSPS